ncbi:MAG TPA: tRNA (N6-threonylcarbamoyladenosine(37)-N6)-methyltransferase TrmO [Polyangiaceae bacterium]
MKRAKAPARPTRDQATRTEKRVARAERNVPELVCRAIGVVHSPFREPKDAPRQPSAARDVRGTIELYSDSGFEHALEDLEAWTHLWVLFWFHRNPGFRPKVLPPRSVRRRGLFATRSPHRPNPLGISCVKLEGVKGLVIEVSGIDMLDGTPVLDIKPYVAYTDAVTEAGAGWLSEAADPAAEFGVSFTKLAQNELSYLNDSFKIELEPQIRTVLALGPQAHPYRRIRRDRSPSASDDTLVLAVKDWRARFRVDGTLIEVLSVHTGYRPRELVMNADPTLDAHRAFVEHFGL